LSKKKFKKGLESLFGDWGGDPIDDAVLELERTEEPKSVEAESAPHSKKDTDRKTNAGKNFTTDLDALFQDVVYESIDEQFEKIKEKKKDKKKKEPVENKKPKAKKKRKVIPRSGGIDSLIRSTVEGSIMQIESTSNKKRVSFVFDKEKLKKLKSIAKVKKSYLKDVIDEVVAEYLQKHSEKYDDLND